eukprot:4465487-Alexandrium_andersonii.AAC.1
MSASLVGSEMCIRDSRRIAHRVAPGSAARDPPRSSPGARPHCAAGPPPVSYTHLTLPTICSV